MIGRIRKIHGRTDLKYSWKDGLERFVVEGNKRFVGGRMYKWDSDYGRTD